MTAVTCRNTALTCEITVVTCRTTVFTCGITVVTCRITAVTCRITACHCICVKAPLAGKPLFKPNLSWVKAQKVPIYPQNMFFLKEKKVKKGKKEGKNEGNLNYLFFD